MSNEQKYNTIFKESFDIDDAMLNEKLTYQSIKAWDSVGHMTLMAALEDAFSIEMDMDDIIDFSSYTIGIDTLKKYGVEI